MYLTTMSDVELQEVEGGPLPLLLVAAAAVLGLGGCASVKVTASGEVSQTNAAGDTSSASGSVTLETVK